MRTRTLLPALVVIPMLLSPPASVAGTAPDYPEFPYSHTEYTEPNRGRFHFSPRSGWMNDINAPLYHNGVYHLFFQHNPHGLQWGTMHWGHATSPDLVHWTQKPIALEPGVHPGDLWSGAGVVDSANTAGLRTGTEDPIVVFTGTSGVRVAYSTDAGRTFQSYNGGAPVVTPPGTSRDPKVFWHQPTNRWVMAIWSDNGGNGVEFYTSPNLLDWTWRSRFAAPWFYECPDLFPLALDGDPGQVRWVLNDAEGEYVVGSFDGTAFTTDWTGPQRLDQGVTTFDNGTFYAGLTVNHMPDGRVVQLAWQPSNRGPTWTGNATFPVELGLRSFPEGARVTRQPIAEIAGLRTSTQTWTNAVVSPTSDPLAGATADTYEVDATFAVAGATATEFGLRLHARPDGTYDRAVAYDRIAQTLNGKPLAPVDGRVSMRVLVDRGQWEIFAGQLSLSDNADFDPAALGLSAYAVGGSVQLVSLTLHRLRSAWGTGEPTLEHTVGGTWRPVGGTWTDVAAGKRGTATGDAFLLSDRTGDDFTYSADVRVVSGAAAGITFRANADATAHYTANVDTSGVVKLWRPGHVVATHPTPITTGRTYRLQVTASGSSIRVSLDGAQVIDAVDTAHTSGRFGVNAFAGTAEHQNAVVDTGGLCTTVTGRWTPAGGVWTDPPGRRRGTAAGDGFHLSDQTAADFTYAGDIRVLAGAAAGLTFRANADATAHYTANVDTAGLVKLWRPGRDIAVAPAPIRAGRTYHLKVVATGPGIQVFLDGAQVIDAVDSTYSSGRFGLNAFAGSAEFANVGTSEFCAAFPGPWTGVGGTWTDGPGGRRGTAVGDAFSLSTRGASTLTYSGDVRLVSGTAAALTFRANATATQHYTATLDSGGLVKLWRPGHVIATRATAVTPGRTYRLTVLAEGPRIRVHLNGTPVIDAVDTAYSSGLLGVNVFDGTAEFQNLTAFDSVRD